MFTRLVVVILSYFLIITSMLQVLKSQEVSNLTLYCLLFGFSIRILYEVTHGDD